ncbi:MAG: sulfatase [Verrucomicrobia bacterium]|jgi:arylsulfatase A-like enzyme|nr:sulfatase [Verrucomicrobiota bacterium]
MNRALLSFVTACSILGIGTSLQGAEKPASAAKPNIIVFLVDDMGLMDTSVPFVVDAKGQPVRYPLNDYYRTPSMEKLAEAGTRFTSFYAHSVCSPTRTSIMTGQNSARTRVTNWISSEGNNRTPYGPEQWNWEGPDEDTVVLPRLLQQAGYRTIHAGKAHFGPADAYAEDPVNLGFDVNIAGNSYGQPGSYYGEDGYGHIKGNKRRAVPGLGAYHGTETYLSEALTLEANKEIEKSVNENRPFFLHMAHYAVHAPFHMDPRFLRNYEKSGKSGQAKAFASMIEGTDKSLADIVAKTRSLGVANNTLVIFLGDNGSDAPLGATHGYSSSAPLRGKKGTHYEGGMRVPFIVAWAEADSGNEWQCKLPITGGTVQTQPGTILDVLPTICNLVGIELPDGMEIDGYDLSQQLIGKRNDSRKEDFLNHFPHKHRSSYFTSYVNGDWKVIYHYPVPTPKQAKAGKPTGSGYELYNLKDDPFEKTNLADSHPEELKAMMGALIEDLEAKNALYPEVDKEVLVPQLPDARRKSVGTQPPSAKPA